MKNNSRIILLVLLLVLSISCNLLTPSTTSTLIAASASITHTPVVSTPTSAPTRLNANGPYVIFAGQGGMWISNPDGSFLTQVSNLDMSESDLRQAISPRGDQLALVVKNDQGLDLVEMAIPSGETKTIAHLLDITNDELNNNPTGHKAFADYAITEYNSLAWQPGDGELLAFMGAIKGPTSDLYTYDPTSGKITQLTDGSSQAILPSWSPDGQYILHYGVDWVPPFGGAIIGYNQLDGVWAVHVPDGKMITEPKPKGTLYNLLVGWQDDTHYITYDSKDTAGAVPPCPYFNLHDVDIVSGKTSPMMLGDFDGGIVQSPQNKAIILASKAACSQTPGNGTFLLMPGQATPTQLLKDAEVQEFDWLPESGVFQAYPIALFSADGLTRYDPPTSDSSFKPAISKKGYQAWEVIENQKGRVEVKTSNEDWKTILNDSVNQTIWDPINGDTLLIATSDDSLFAASYPDFTPRLMGTMKKVQQAIWLP